MIPRRERIAKEVNKSPKSKKDYEVFCKQNFNLNVELPCPEVFVCYFRALQIYIFKKRDMQELFLNMALDVGKVNAIKFLQAYYNETQDGVIGSFTRNKMNTMAEDCDVKKIKNIQYTLKYRILKLIRTWKNDY